MKASKFLRIASIIALIQYSAHAFLFLSATPKHGQDEISLIEAMKSHHWNFAGFDHSYWDFYLGYGLLVILWGFIEVLLLWQLSILAKNVSIRLKPIIALLLLVNVGHAVLTLRYFFLVPAIFDLIVALFLGFAFISIGKNSKS